MLTRKFDYTVDPEHSLIKATAKTGRLLDRLCPIAVAAARIRAQRASSATLYMVLQESTSALTTALLIGTMLFGEDRSAWPDSASSDLQAAILLSSTAVEELARRYQANALEPELHVGDTDSLNWAKAHDDREPAAPDSEPIAEESDSDRIVVNGASDGIF